MQKAHLYEAVFLMNQGASAQVNLQFLVDMQQAEKRQAARYDRPPSGTGEQRNP